jgi:hypothetical protein
MRASSYSGSRYSEGGCGKGLRKAVRGFVIQTTDCHAGPRAYRAVPIIVVMSHYENTDAKQKAHVI